MKFFGISPIGFLLKIFSKKPIGDIPENFILHDQRMENVKSYTHIGKERKPCSQDVVETRIQTARRTSYALLMGVGMHGYNGINPEIIMKICNTYVRPRLVFGLDSIVLRDRPFNLKGGGYSFLFRSEFFFRTIQELEYLFFLSRKAQIFFPEFNIRLYDKNSESDFVFFLHQNQNIFFRNIGNQNIFSEKINHNPPLQVK